MVWYVPHPRFVSAYASKCLPGHDTDSNGHCYRHFGGNSTAILSAATAILSAATATAILSAFLPHSFFY